ncbi:MAG: hypothetical protein UT39_C0015G0010 [Candidatus Woesebacteria bacterium GW2011_GWA1_39_21]|uniref:Uncharacterized protein n=1 Tax=Candidatus Woesebacteria bacterium GW2011_GWA1_39_21 TaxID=1618550 RepID=A0A0G0RAS3_9BACT|nr:MAG: hypothetical protein UT39_C0015G0010 [Candidatus Woesebacteria bacterium GW2011_GWA1_39_21]
MKRVLYSLLTLLFLLTLVCPGLASAQIDIAKPSIGTAIAPAPDYYQTNTFLGQNHSYSVIFRGNGEGIVNLRVALGNSGTEAIKEVNLRVPAVAPTDIYVFQILKEKQCIRYATPVYDPTIRSYPPTTCEEYQDPDYYNDYYYYNAKYKKADYDLDNDTLTVTLPVSISAGKSGAFFVYFRAMGYAKKDVYGAYDYTFESLKTEDSVRSLNIGLSTDSDLYMKSAKGTVDYRFKDVAPSMMALGKGGGGEMGAASPALDSYVTSIGQGSIYKSASNLSPLESYKVEGSYADSRAKLYGKEILIGVSVFVGIVILFVVLLMVVVRLLRKGNPPVKKETPDLLNEKAIGTSVEKTAKGNGQMFAVSVLLGFVDSLLIASYTVLVVALGSFMSNSVSYTYRSLVIMVLVVVSILIYLLLIFAPGVLIGVKRGVGWGIGVIVSTVLWLILWIAVIFFVIFLFGTSGGVLEMLRGSIGVTPVAY